jgi:hypothetical protein
LPSRIREARAVFAGEKMCESEKDVDCRCN